MKTKADTISAVATAAGEGGIGIVRISGDEAIDVAAKIFRAASGQKLQDAADRRALYGRVVDFAGETVDEALVLVMRAPHSYTAENVTEIQCHGGAMPLKKVLALTYEAGARPAERGEFTERAFLNGRIDLTQAQAVMDMVRAKTEGSRRMAAAALAGQTAAKVAALRHEILGIIAHLEALIDFPEDDVENLGTREAVAQITAVLEKTNRFLQATHASKILRDGLTCAIAGKPNVGKSSLLNALLNEERAIVTDIPGTTRDSIEEFIDVGGIPLKIIDTAGIRETGEKIEQIGIDRAKTHIESADMVLAVFDASREFDAADEKIIALLKGKNVIALLNKCDLPTVVTVDMLREKLPQAAIVKTKLKFSPDDKAAFSAEESLATLVTALQEKCSMLDFCSEDGIIVESDRQEYLLRKTKDHLAAALDAAQNDFGEDFVVIDLRGAWEALGSITGETVTEDIIDAVFAEFCIGK